MKDKNGIRVVLDIALVATLVAVMATALVQEAPHEWLVNGHPSQKKLVAWADKALEA